MAIMEWSKTRVNVEDVVEKILQDEGIRLRFNEFTRQIMFTGPAHGEQPIDDVDRSRITAVLFNAGLKSIGKVQDAAVTIIADKPENRFHPVVNYLNGLRWDGKPRVETWLVDYLQADNTEYTRAVGRLFLTAAVRRVRQPGCKFDECLVLVGKEGIGKSSALQTLAGEWFSDSLPLGADPKLTVEQTTGVWICESAELVGNTPSKIAEIKAFLSRQVDGPFRKAYGREPGMVRRQFVPVATTNDRTFLHSVTGDRRFWPVQVHHTSSHQLKAERDQIWAEAAAMEARGESIRLDEKLWPVAKSAQEQHRIVDPWESEIEPLIASGKDLTLPQIWAALNIPVEKRTGKDAARINGIMMKLGFEGTRTMKNGQRTTHYEKLHPLHPSTFDRNPETAPVEPDVEDPAMEAQREEQLRAEAEIRQLELEDKYDVESPEFEEV